MITAYSRWSLFRHWPFSGVPPSLLCSEAVAASEWVGPDPLVPSHTHQGQGEPTPPPDSPFARWLFCLFNHFRAALAICWLHQLSDQIPFERCKGLPPPLSCSHQTLKWKLLRRLLEVTELMCFWAESRHLIPWLPWNSDHLPIGSEVAQTNMKINSALVLGMGKSSWISQKREKKELGEKHTENHQRT